MRACELRAIEALCDNALQFVRRLCELANFVLSKQLNKGKRGPNRASMREPQQLR